MLDSRSLDEELGNHWACHQLDSGVGRFLIRKNLACEALEIVDGQARAKKQKTRSETTFFT